MWLGFNNGVALLESIQSSGSQLHYDRKILALNTESGNLLWTFNGESDYPTATGDNGRVYIGDTNKSYVVDLKSGAKIQEYAIERIMPPFTANRFFRPLNDLVISKIDDRNLIQAREATTGLVQWSFSDNTGRGFISIQVVNNTLYTMGLSRSVCVLDLATGALRWKTVQCPPYPGQSECDLYNADRPPVAWA